MLKLTLLCLFVIQVLSVQAKTYGEVVEDMEPLFKLYRNTVSSYQMILLDSERITQLNITKYLISAWHQIYKKAEEFPINIKNESTTIVTELGMTSHMDKIQHCIADMNTTTSEVQNIIIIGSDICRASGRKNLNLAIDSALNPMYGKLTSTQTSLESIKETCSSFAADQGLICIASILYRRWDPQIEDMKTETTTAMTNMNTAVSYVTDSFDMCNGIVARKFNENKPILDEFRKCVQDVANNMY